MQFVLAKIVYSFLILISLLPFRFLYVLSDVVYFLLYRVIGYRKKVVRANIKIAFPEYTTSQIIAIEKEFYKHFCDMFLEMIKTLSISKEDLLKRYTFSNIKLLKEYEAKGKSIVLMMSHYANWEWSMALNHYLSFQGYGIYRPLQNGHFDKIVRNIRSRFDTELISAYSLAREMRNHDRKGTKGVYLFINDQTPMLRKNQYWQDFFGINVPVFDGAEHIAINLDMTVLFLKVKKVKRGYYSAEFIEITDQARDTSDHFITRKFIQLVENQIKEEPKFYFWTHKRWKHQGKK